MPDNIKLSTTSNLLDQITRKRDVVNRLEAALRACEQRSPKQRLWWINLRGAAKARIKKLEKEVASRNVVNTTHYGTSGKYGRNIHKGVIHDEEEVR